MTLTTSDDYLHHLCAVIEKIQHNCRETERPESHRELEEIKIAAYALAESFNTFGYDIISNDNKLDKSIEYDSNLIGGCVSYDDMMKLIIQRFDLVGLIKKDTKLEKKGNNYLGLCPFHKEWAPSFSVSISKNFYYCAGCQKSGNVLNYLMDYKKMTEHEACEFLIKNFINKETTDA